MKLSPHFTLAEMTATAVRLVDNTPSNEEVANLTYLCQQVLEPVRNKFGVLHTTSGYRSPEVNRRIGGSPTSAHCRGLAWDGVPLRDLKWMEVVEFIVHSDIPFDQVIYEYGRWLHIGAKPEGLEPRREALMIFSPGKYEVWNPKDSRVVR
jgi:zinc D-Ala-D-Ala carboxypeptidase